METFWKQQFAIVFQLSSASKTQDGGPSGKLNVRHDRESGGGGEGRWERLGGGDELHYLAFRPGFSRKYEVGRE